MHLEVRVNEVGSLLPLCGFQVTLGSSGLLNQVTDGVSCSLSYLQISFVAKDDLELLLLPALPECLDYSCALPLVP